MCPSLGSGRYARPLTLSALRGAPSQACDERHTVRAERICARVDGLAQRSPRFARSALASICSLSARLDLLAQRSPRFARSALDGPDVAAGRGVEVAVAGAGNAP